ncbi:type 1 glutamine amidotransferase [Acetobacter sp. TBRC 12305]|uniref:Type 1 glutamine amidotransferase n=1 Tax=Acetobacter garciniae TaxID=2817435 RepID=A0A939KPV6_9PROT|nr:type 1 glutamine amidotransferase [Acetobacter garciniae]MBO1324447.1 type 1 glutamine amidotransferase [Acetobacter garciniae]MBX0344136.1 type 1 glutamine amidotransferase [Acetobacter garciniae]
MTSPRKILYLSNGPSLLSSARLDQRLMAEGVEVELAWAFNNVFPDTLDGYAGIVLSGSPHGAYEDIPFIHREHDLIREAAARNIPMLGLCFGHQILASALCGRDQVFRRSSCEVGFKVLPTSAAASTDPLCADFGESVEMFVWHNDEVRADHPDMTILASSDICPNQIWRYRDASIWGVQGHPEVGRNDVAAWLEERRPRLERDGADVDLLAHDPPDMTKAGAIFRRFVRVCEGGA